MNILLLGATGLLGQSVAAEAISRGFNVYGIARTGAWRNVDIGDLQALNGALVDSTPDLVINAAAETSIERCESSPERAYVVNARPTALLAQYCRATGTRLVHVSTDHYYLNEGPTLHRESDPIHLVNEYARTKYAAEGFASLCSESLILRTNIVGLRGSGGQLSFGDWVVDSLRHRKPMTLFNDAFHSPIHVRDFSRCLFDLVSLNVCGTLNLAGSEVVTKAKFIQCVAEVLGINFDWYELGSISSLKIQRADSLGLDVSRVEALLGRRMPTVYGAAQHFLADMD